MKNLFGSLILFLGLATLAVAQPTPTYSVTVNNAGVVQAPSNFVAANNILTLNTGVPWNVIYSKPTTLSGYGITDPIVLTSGNYANPAWIYSLSWSKLISTPTSLAGYGINDPVVLTTGSYSNPSWLTSVAWTKVTGTPTTASTYGITNGANLDSIGAAPQTGSGSLVFSNSPALTTPNIGLASATSVNGLKITSTTGTLTLAGNKTFSVNNTLTLAGTDNSTLNVGTGGTLGTAAYTATSAYDASGAAAAVSANSLQKASNLSDVASVSSARTNLGVTATGADTTYAYRANNLSDLASASTARTNLGLGTAATANSTAFDASGAAASAQAYAIQRSNHTGTQPASTITGLATSATTDTTNASNIASGTLPNARLASVPNSALANSSVTVTAGSGLSGGGAVSLGGSVSLSANVTSVAGRTGSVTLSSGDVSGLSASATTDATNASNITSGTLPNARLSSVPNSALANSTITIAGNSTALGGSVSQDSITGLSSTGIVKRTSANTLATAVADTDYTTPGGTETLTNKTISGASNTLSNIANASLTNSSVTVAAGSGLSGGGSVALGGTTTLTANVTSVAGRTGAVTLSTTDVSGLGTVATQTAPSGTSSQLLANNGTGGFSNVTVGSGVSLSGGTLTATGLGGTVTSVSGTGSVNGITLSGSVTTSGSLTLGGTLNGISNSQLTNNSITIAGNSTALGGTVSQDQITGLSSTGIVKRTAANTLATAVSGTDYAPATTGNSSQLLANNGSGGHTNVNIGSGVSFSGGTLSATGLGGTVTSVNGTGSVNGITLSGSVTGSGSLTLGGALSGISNSQLTNNSVTVTAGTGLSGGGAVALGGTTTLTANVVTVAGRTGSVTLSSGDISGLAASATTDATNASNISSGTLPNARLSSVPNSALANNSITVTAGSGLSGGGTVALGSSTTLTANVTSVAGRTGAVTISQSDVSGLTTSSSPTFSGATINGTFTNAAGSGYKLYTFINSTNSDTGLLLGSTGDFYHNGIGIYSDSYYSQNLLISHGFPLYLGTTDANPFYLRSNGNTVLTLSSSGTATFANAVTISSNTASTSTTNGALILSGGAGITGNINVGGNSSIAGTETVTGGIQNTPIGATTPNTGAFTTVTASTSVRSPSIGATTGNLSLVSNGSTNATLDSSGDLLIGTTVSNTLGRGLSGLSVASSGSAELQVLSPIGSTSEIDLGVNATRMSTWQSDATYGTYFGTSTSLPLNFQVNNGVVGTFSTAGKFGIGTTSPTGLFSINSGSAGYSYGSFKYADSDYGYIGQARAFAGAGSTTDLSLFSYNNLTFYTNNSSTEKMRLDTNGNLGLGTSSPSYPLDIYNASNGIVRIKGGSATNQGSAFFVTKAGSGSTLMAMGDSARINGGTPDAAASIFTNTGIPLRFDVGNQLSMYLDSTGNLGLGVAPSGWGSGWKVFQNTGGFLGTNGNSVQVLGTNAYSNGSNWIYYGNGYSANYAQINGVHSWSVAPSGTAGGTVNYTTAMTLDNSGNLTLSSGGLYTPSIAYVGLNLNGQTGGDYSLHYAGSGGGTYPIRLSFTNDSGTQRHFQVGYYTGAASSTAWNNMFDVNAYSGNTVINSTTSSTSTTSGALVVGGGVGIAGNAWANGFYAGVSTPSSTGSVNFIQGDYGTTPNWTIAGTGSSYSYSGVGGNELWFLPFSSWNALDIGSNGTIPIKFIVGGEVARFDSSGNLDIGGTYSPFGSKLYVGGNTGNSPLFSAYNYGNSNWAGIAVLNDAGSVSLWSNGGTLTFRNSSALNAGVETMRIDGSSNFLVGTTTTNYTATNGFGAVQTTGATYVFTSHPSGTSSGSYYHSFDYNGSQIGLISQSGTTAVVYNTTSDKRLKTALRSWSLGDKFDSLPIGEFNWLKSGELAHGTLAQDLYKVYPDAVHVGSDKKDDKGNLVEPWGVDYGKLTVPLIAEVKTLRSRVKTLEQDNADLKATLNDVLARLSALESKSK